VSYAVVEVTPDGVIVRGELGALRAAHLWSTSQRRTKARRSRHSRAGFQPAASTASSGLGSSAPDQLLRASGRALKKTSLTSITSLCPNRRHLGYQGPDLPPDRGTQITPSGHEISIVAAPLVSCPTRDSQLIFHRGGSRLLCQPGGRICNDTTTLRGAIAGHVGVQSDLPETEQSSRNTLVYFADWRSEKPLANLNAALSRRKSVPRPWSSSLCRPVPLKSSRREFEGRLPPIGERASAPMQFTEDDEGGWTRTFGVVKTPSAYLVNAQREFVWKHEGEPDPSALAAVLDQHAVAARAPQFRPLRLTIAPGDSAPDATFEDDLGDQFALHRFRGRNMLLNFWHRVGALPRRTFRACNDSIRPARKNPLSSRFMAAKTAEAG